MTELDFRDEVVVSNSAPEAANGRFFCAPDCYNFTESFWLENEALLSPSFGLVVQASLSAGGKNELVEVGSGEVRKPIVTVYVDASSRSEGVYWWSVCTADSDGRVVYKVEVTPHDISSNKQVYDCQGRLSASASISLGMAETLKAFELAYKYANDPVAMSKREKLRSEKAKEDELSGRSFMDVETTQEITSIGQTALLGISAQ